MTGYVLEVNRAEGGQSAMDMPGGDFHSICIGQCHIRALLSKCTKLH